MIEKNYTTNKFNQNEGERKGKVHKKWNPREKKMGPKKGNEKFNASK